MTIWISRVEVQRKLVRNLETKNKLKTFRAKERKINKTTYLRNLYYKKKYTNIHNKLTYNTALPLILTPHRGIKIQEEKKMINKKKKTKICCLQTCMPGGILAPNPNAGKNLSL